MYFLYFYSQAGSEVWNLIIFSRPQVPDPLRAGVTILPKIKTETGFLTENNWENKNCGISGSAMNFKSQVIYFSYFLVKTPTWRCRTRRRCWVESSLLYLEIVSKVNLYFRPIRCLQYVLDKGGDNLPDGLDWWLCRSLFLDTLHQGGPLDPTNKWIHIIKVSYPSKSVRLHLLLEISTIIRNFYRTHRNACFDWHNMRLVFTFQGQLLCNLALRPVRTCVVCKIYV